MAQDSPDWTLLAYITSSGVVTVKVTNAVLSVSGTVSVTTGTINIAGNVTVVQVPTTAWVGKGQLTTSGGGSPYPAQYTLPQLGRTVFGTGTTGTVTLSATTTLTRNVTYKNLTIAASVTVHTAGYRVLVKTVCTSGAGTVLTCSGTPGVTGNVSNTHFFAGGLGAPAGFYKGGGNGGSVTMSGTPSSRKATPGANTPYYTLTKTPQALLILQGGAGATGVAVVTPLTGAGGLAGVGRALTPIATALRTAFLCGGAGGGGALAYESSGTHGAQASGGGGGGVLFFGSHTLKGPLVLRAQGGVGKGIKNSFAVAVAGPGGGGVVVFLSHFTQTWTGSIQNTGGATTVITGHTPTPAPPGQKKVQRSYNGHLV